MKYWFWVCNVTRYRTLWDEWKKRGIASLGWPPKFIRNRPSEKARLRRNLEQAERMEVGDRVVAYLKNSRIGGIGVLEQRIPRGVWKPIIEGDHGRMAKIDWKWLPCEGHYAFAPEGTVPRRMSAIYPIKDVARFKLLMKAVKDKRMWGALGNSRYLAKGEKADLHPLIAKSLDLLEKGLRPNRWGPLREYPAWPAGFIDLLAEDRNGNAVVIEAKRHSCGDETIGQVLRYKAWVKRNIPNAEMVRAIIVAGECTPQIRYAASEVDHLLLFHYRIPKPGKIEFLPVKEYSYNR